jgi:hypothetical protein
MYEPALGRLKPTFLTAKYDTAQTHTVLPPAGEGKEWNIAHIEFTATQTGANDIAVNMGSNNIVTVALAVAGDHRPRTPNPYWRCGDNQPLTITLSAALGVRVNIEYYLLPAYA